MRKRNLVVSMFAMLFLSSCQIDLGSFRIKEPPPLGSDVAVSLPDQGDDNEIDAIISTVEDIEEHANWPISVIQAFFMRHDLEDPIPNIILETRIFTIEKDYEDYSKLSIYIFGDNPVLFSTVGDAHVALDWIEVDADEGIELKSPSESVVFTSHFLEEVISTNSEESFPAHTEFEYWVEIETEQSNGGPFDNLDRGTAEDVDALNLLDDFTVVLGWPFNIITNEFGARGRNDFVAEYEIDHDVYYAQVYDEEHELFELKIVLLGDNPQLVGALSDPYLDHKDWQTRGQHSYFVSITTNDSNVEVAFNYYDEHNEHNVPVGTYVVFSFPQPR